MRRLELMAGDVLLTVAPGKAQPEKTNTADKHDRNSRGEDNADVSEHRSNICRARSDCIHIEWFYE